MTYTTLQALVTKTAAFDGAEVDVSGITGDWVMKLRIAALTAAKTVRVELQDTVDAFTGQATIHTWHFLGSVANPADIVRSISSRDLPNARIGIANAGWRISITVIDGSSSVDYEAWLES